MFLPMLAVVLVVLFLLTFLPIALTRVARAAPNPHTPPALADADRYSRRSTAQAVLIGLAAAGATAILWGLAERSYLYLILHDALSDTVVGDSQLIVGTFPGPIDLGLVIAPSVMGVVGLLVLVLRERRCPLVTTPTRTASLRPRRVSDCASWPLAVAVAVAVALVLLLSLLVIGTLTADASGTAHTWEGTWRSELGTVEASSTRGPWPGVVYSVPILMLTLIQIALAVVGLRDIAARGQVTSRADDAPDAELDAALRRRSADAVIGLLLISISLPTIAAGLAMAPIAGDALGEYPVLGREYLALGLWALACAGLALLALGVGTALMLRRPAAIRERLATGDPLLAAPDEPVSADSGEGARS